MHRDSGGKERIFWMMGKEVPRMRGRAEEGGLINVIICLNSRLGPGKAFLLKEGHSAPRFLSRAPCELPSSSLETIK